MTTRTPLPLLRHLSTLPSLRTSALRPSNLTPLSHTTRSFTFSPRRLQESTTTPPPPPPRKPVGAFRGGLLGFFMGATLAGTAVWFYILEEYRVCNEMLGEDVYSLQAAVQRTEQYVRVLEERVALMGERKKGE